MPDVHARFWAKIARGDQDECWPWLAGINQYGYGQFSWNGSKVGAHRVSYMIHCGPIPDGMSINHICHDRDISCAGGVGCRHRRCVNPTHLEVATAKEQAVRAAITSQADACRHGHEYTESNTAWQTDGAGRRSKVCRTCRRARDRERYRRNPAKRRAQAYAARRGMTLAEYLQEYA